MFLNVFYILIFFRLLRHFSSFIILFVTYQDVTIHFRKVFWIYITIDRLCNKWFKLFIIYLINWYLNESNNPISSLRVKYVTFYMYMHSRSTMRQTSETVHGRTGLGSQINVDHLQEFISFIKLLKHKKNWRINCDDFLNRMGIKDSKFVWSKSSPTVSGAVFPP